MKARSTALNLAAVLLACTSLTQVATAGEAKFSPDEQIGGTFETLPISPRYSRPSAVGGLDAMPPASALTPIPPNSTFLRHDYALGEASVDSYSPGYGDAKGRATHDRHYRRHARTAWTRHAFD